MIFKASPEQAHGMHATFKPGFGCTIAEAVVASCSAYPVFRKKTIRTSEGSDVVLIDGGYCANNPTLYAIADAVKALNRDNKNLRVVSIGVGVYPEPPRYMHKWSTFASSTARSTRGKSTSHACVSAAYRRSAAWRFASLPLVWRL